MLYINDVYDDESHLFRQCMECELSRQFNSIESRDWRWAALLRKANPTERFEEIFYVVDELNNGNMRKTDNSRLADIKFDEDGFVYYRFKIHSYTIPSCQFLKVNCLYNDIIYKAYEKHWGYYQFD